MKDRTNKDKSAAVPQTISEAQWTRFCDGAAVAFARKVDIGDAWQATADAIAANAGSN